MYGEESSASFMTYLGMRNLLRSSVTFVDV